MFSSLVRILHDFPLRFSWSENFTLVNYFMMRAFHSLGKFSAQSNQYSLYCVGFNLKRRKTFKTKMKKKEKSRERNFPISLTSDCRLERKLKFMFRVLRKAHGLCFVFFSELETCLVVLEKTFFFCTHAQACALEIFMKIFSFALNLKFKNT